MSIDVARAGTAGWALGAPTRPLTRSWDRRYIAALVVADACSAWAAGLFAYTVRFSGGEQPRLYTFLTMLLPTVWVATVGANRAYEFRYLGIGSEEFRRVMTGAVWLVAIVGTFSWAFKLELARGYILVALPVTTAITLVGRYVVRKQLHRLRARGRCQQRVVVVGQALAVADLVQQLRREPYHGYQVVGACLPAGADRDGLDALEVPVGGNFDGVAATVRKHRADTVAVLTCPEMDGPRLRRLSWELEQFGTDILVAPTLVEVAGPRISIRPAAGLPLMHVEHPRLTGGRRVAKAAFDRIGSALLLFVLSPLLILIASLVKLTSPGPVLFRQTRYGRFGEEFLIYKFRTMVNNAEELRAELDHLNKHSEGPLFKIDDDPRITRVGAILRKYSLDELPQLLNVLFGHMSLVGPRPPLPEEVQRYGIDARRRLVVKPGLTGLWQISGRSDLSWEDSVRLDLRYVENWSLALDAMILWKTVFVVAKGNGAY
ncbi:MAG: sugar transferase [Sporichthyaceae bacterium]|nr:sugar transferase [Sporichthyaceae bacterium]